MNLINFLSFGDRDFLQSVLYRVAGIFLFIYSLILTLAPAVRFHSWNVSYRWEHWVGFFICIGSFYFTNKISQKKMSNRDPYLLPIVGLLMGIGLLTIFRLNVNFGLRQSLWIILSTIILFVSFQKSEWLKRFRNYKYLWLLFGLALTALTFFLGIYPSGNGPQLWLSFGGIFIQPSEPLKILLIIYLSAYLSDRWSSRKNFPALIIPTIIVILLALLLLVGQRDLGTASIFIFIFAFYMFLVSGKRRILILFALILFIAGYIGYQMFGVIKIRVDSWLNPWLDPGGNSYQVLQSIQAMAAGKLLGSGPGVGSPGLIPVALSDFIFAAITEELGLFGALSIFCLYVFIFYRGILISIKASNQYQKLLSAGITVLIAAQSILILGGNTRLLPLTGVTLPFISYGGSSLLTSVFSVALLMWVSQQTGSKNISIHETKPYVFTFKTILVAFIALSLVTGWWTIIRSDVLLARPDNLRRIINDRYVKRGTIMDRNNNPIAMTVGIPGEYYRFINEPSLSATIGYINPVYGLGGLEFSMDDYLRGIAGLPSFDTTISDLLYSQPPVGLDLRTSIDLKIQTQLTSTLSNFIGAAIVMNAATGEILGLWTSPSFDSNKLDKNWESWKSDPNSPLINRATQGYYSAGTIISPFLLSYTGTDNLEDNFSVRSTNCALPLPSNTTDLFDDYLKNGCEDLLIKSIELLPENEISSFFSTFGWTEQIQFELPQIDPVQIPYNNLNGLWSNLYLSPLQISRAAAIFSNSGTLPYPRISMAVNIPKEGWIVLSSNESKQVRNTRYLPSIVELLSQMDIPTWEFSSNSIEEDANISWYVTGTLPEWQSTPIVLTIVLEDSQPEIARINGRKLIGEIINILPEP